MCTGCFKVADNTDTCSCYFLPQSCLSLSCRRELIMISDCCIHRQQTKNDTFQNYMNYTAGYSLMYIYMYIHVCSVYECVCVHWERRENNDIVYCNENEESCQMCVFSGCIFCSFSTEHWSFRPNFVNSRWVLMLLICLKWSKSHSSASTSPHTLSKSINKEQLELNYCIIPKCIIHILLLCCIVKLVPSSLVFVAGLK